MAAVCYDKKITAEVIKVGSRKCTKKDGFVS